MTITTVRMTSTPMYELNTLCEINHIPYMHVQITGIGRYGTTKDYVDTLLIPNKLVIVESLSTLALYFDSMLEQKVLWSVIVRGSELEAAEHGLAYALSAYTSWIVNSLLAKTQVLEFPVKQKQVNKNNSYLSQVLTDLYRVKPKEARPFDVVFEYLAGKRKFPKNLPEYLIKSLKAAEPIRTAVLALQNDYSIECVRAIAKLHQMDVFDINYTLARNGLLPNSKEAK